MVPGVLLGPAAEVLGESVGGDREVDAAEVSVVSVALDPAAVGAPSGLAAEAEAVKPGAGKGDPGPERG